MNNSFFTILLIKSSLKVFWEITKIFQFFHCLTPIEALSHQPLASFIIRSKFFHFAIHQYHFTINQVSSWLVLPISLKWSHESWKLRGGLSWSKAIIIWMTGPFNERFWVIHPIIPVNSLVIVNYVVEHGNFILSLLCSPLDWTQIIYHLQEKKRCEFM